MSASAKAQLEAHGLNMEEFGTLKWDVDRICSDCERNLVDCLRQSKGEDVRLLRGLERNLMYQGRLVLLETWAWDYYQTLEKKIRTGEVLSEQEREIHEQYGELAKSIEPKHSRLTIPNEYERGKLEGRISALEWALDLHRVLTGEY
jgi:hypothetical protein